MEQHKADWWSAFITVENVIWLKRNFVSSSVLTLSGGFNAKVGFNVKAIIKTWFYHTKLLCWNHLKTFFELILSSFYKIHNLVFDDIVTKSELILATNIEMLKTETAVLAQS